MQKSTIITIVAAVGGLLVGTGLGAVAQPEATTVTRTATPAPAPTVTVTATPAPAPTVTVTKTAAPPPPKVTTFEGTSADFVVTLTITEQKCFGSAGCNVNYRVETPAYIGTAPLPTSGTIEVTYKVLGAEDPIMESFTVSGGQVRWSETGYASTQNADVELTAEVTAVNYRNY